MAWADWTFLEDFRLSYFLKQNCLNKSTNKGVKRVVESPTIMWTALHRKERVMTNDYLSCSRFKKIFWTQSLSFLTPSKKDLSMLLTFKRRSMSWASKPPSKAFCQPQEGGEAAQWLGVAVDTTTPGEEGGDITTHAAVQDSVEEEVSCPILPDCQFTPVENNWHLN